MKFMLQLNYFDENIYFSLIKEACLKFVELAMIFWNKIFVLVITASQKQVMVYIYGNKMNFVFLCGNLLMNN